MIQEIGSEYLISVLNLSKRLDTDWSKKQYEDILENKDYIVLGYFEETVLLGYCIVICLVDEIEVLQIVSYTSSKGIGSKLMKSIVEYGQVKEYIRILLEVNEVNSHAIHFYKKFNFKEIGIRKHYYGMNSAIVMERVI